MKFCKKCGAAIDDFDTACQSCGEKQQNVYKYVSNESTNSTSANRNDANENRIDGDGNRNGANANRNDGNANRNGANANRIDENENGTVENRNNINENKNITNGFMPQYQNTVFGKKPGMQQLLSQAPISPSFIASSVLGGILMLLGLTLFLFVLSLADTFEPVCIVFLILLPFSMLVIGQYIFIGNGVSKSKYMSMKGVSVIKVSLILHIIYSVICAVYISGKVYKNVSELDKEIKEVWYLNSYVKSIKKEKERLIIYFTLVMIFMILNFMALIKMVNMLGILRVMGQTEVVPKSELSIFPTIVFRINAVILFLGVIGCFVEIEEYKKKYSYEYYYYRSIYDDDKEAGYIMLAILLIVIAVYYLLIARAIMVFRQKIEMYRYVINQEKWESDKGNAYVQNGYQINYSPTTGMDINSNNNRYENRFLDNNGWRCACGVVNPSNIETCGCGRTKKQVEEQNRKQQEEEQKKKQQAKQQDALAAYNLKIDNIKKMKELLDAGAITQEEFDENKKKILDDM